MKILVTGGNGYLGEWTVEDLKRAGHKVDVRNSHGAYLNDPPFLDVKDLDAVVHLGWYSKVGNGEREIQKNCLQRTGSLLEEVGTEPLVIFASSAAIYGSGPKGEYCFRERDPTFPQCAYSVNKLLAEEMVRTRAGRSLIFRFASLMGKGLRRTKTDLCVNAFAVDGYLRKRIEVWNPDCYKPVLHVRDASDFVRRAIEEEWTRPGWSIVLNAACGSHMARSIAILAASTTRAEIVCVESGINEARSLKLDCTLLRNKLPHDYKFRSLKEAIAEFEDFKESPTDKSIPWTR